MCPWVEKGFALWAYFPVMRFKKHIYIYSHSQCEKLMCIFIYLSSPSLLIFKSYALECALRPHRPAPLSGPELQSPQSRLCQQEYPSEAWAPSGLCAQNPRNAALVLEIRVGMDSSGKSAGDRVIFPIVKSKQASKHHCFSSNNQMKRTECFMYSNKFQLQYPFLFLDKK